jgi:hypothetical protein
MSMLARGKGWKRGTNHNGKNVLKSDSRIEKQELHCHNCNHYVQFNLDLSLDGNHVFKCPVCGHEHCRVVMDGKITNDRWDQRNGATYQVTSVTYSIGSVTAATSDLYFSWANATTTANSGY